MGSVKEQPKPKRVMLQHPVHVEDFNSHEISVLVSKKRKRVAHTSHLGSPALLHREFKTSQPGCETLFQCFKQTSEEFGSPTPRSAWNWNVEVPYKRALAPVPTVCHLQCHSSYSNDSGQ